MVFFGYCEQARRGVICHPITVIGKTRIGAFVVGATVVCGKNYWNC
jgi:hypothetical protein